MKWKILFVCSLVALVSGCHAPPYSPPCVVSPTQWKACAPPCTAPCVENWWEIFNDPNLNALEIQAVTNSPQLYIARSRIVESRALAGIKKADLYPQVELNPRYTNQGRLFKIYGLPTGIIPGLPNNVFRIHQLDYYFPFEMSYEIDLWGRLKKQYLSAKLDAQATAADFCVTLLTLTSDLASHYFNVRTLDAQIAYYNQEVEIVQKNVNLITLRYTDGLISEVDVETANLELANLKARALDLIRQRRLFENAIAVLIGLPASDFCLPSLPICNLPPCIPPGVPCSILTKRPDVREVELKRAAEYALVDSAYASFLPTLTIRGVLGFYSPTLEDFLTWKSRWWLIGGTISQTILDGGRKVANLHAAWARFHEADGEYQRTVLNAFREVENALSNIDLYLKEYQTLSEARSFAQKRLSLSQNQYIEGLANYLVVLDSERSKVNVEINSLNSLGASYQATIQLIKALGGSWDCDCLIAADDERKTEMSLE